MHILHLGIIRDIVGSCVVDMLKSRDLHKYVGLGEDASNDLVLYRLTSMARAWAKEHKLELSIKPLTESTVGYSSTSYAGLESSIKAARARVLFEFVCKVCIDVEHSLPASSDGITIYHAQLRASMCFSLSACLSIWTKGCRPSLSDQERSVSVAMGRLFLEMYAALSLEAQIDQKLLFKVRPKHHYMRHLLDQTEISGRNPLALSNFTDEDHMKHLRGISLGCHPLTVTTTWARRYILKQTLLWQRLQQTPKAVKK